MTEFWPFKRDGFQPFGRQFFHYADLLGLSAGSTSGVISSFSDDEITMTDSSGATKALPGALNGSGNGSAVTWERSS
jgi:hypothetical protein